LAPAGLVVAARDDTPPEKLILASMKPPDGELGGFCI